MFVHLDIDAFFASVEQRINPWLRGRPVVVGSGVIASCSYEARAQGLHAGMPLRQARRRCPEVVILQGDSRTYAAFAEPVFDACRRVAPCVEIGLDEACCDMRGTERMHDGIVRAAKRLKADARRESGLDVSVGVASSRMLAKIAGQAAKPDGFAVVPADREQAFLDPLPIEKLPGVGPRAADTLRKMNVCRVADLRCLPRTALEALFGAVGSALYERCRGRDARPVSLRETPKSISRETSFHRDEDDRVQAGAMLHYLAERAARALRDSGLQARAVSVRVGYADYAGDSARVSFGRPEDLDDAIFDAASGLLRRVWTRRAAIRRIGITLSGLTPSRGEETLLFPDEARDRRARLCRSVDAVRERFGHAALVVGPSLHLLPKLARDANGYVLRTPCLTK